MKTLTFHSIINSLNKSQEIFKSPWQIYEKTSCTNLVNRTSRKDFFTSFNLNHIPRLEDSKWNKAPTDENGNVFIKDRFPTPWISKFDDTFFQTKIEIPPKQSIRKLLVSFDKLSYGLRVYIFNSKFPNGAFDLEDNSNIFQKKKGFVNLKQFAQAGEVNRIVIVQLANCCVENNLCALNVSLNGKNITSKAD